MEPHQPKKPSPLKPPPAPQPRPPSSQSNNSHEQGRVYWFVQQNLSLFGPISSIPVPSTIQALDCAFETFFLGQSPVNRIILQGRFSLLRESLLQLRPPRHDIVHLAFKFLSPYDIYGFSDSLSRASASAPPPPAHPPHAQHNSFRPVSAEPTARTPTPAPTPPVRAPFVICDSGHSSVEEAEIELDKLFYPFYHKTGRSRPSDGKWRFTCCMDGCEWAASIKRIDENGRSTFYTYYTAKNSTKHLPLTAPLPAHHHPFPSHGFASIEEFPLTQHLKTLILDNVDVVSGTQSDRAKAIIDFLWSDRNTDPFFRTLPIYTDDRLRDKFRFYTSLNIARRLYRQESEARARSKRKPVPGDFGTDREPRPVPRRPPRQSPTTSPDSSKPAALPKKSAAVDDRSPTLDSDEPSERGSMSTAAALPKKSAAVDDGSPTLESDDPSERGSTSTAAALPKKSAAVDDGSPTLESDDPSERGSTHTDPAPRSRGSDQATADGDDDEDAEDADNDVKVLTHLSGKIRKKPPKPASHDNDSDQYIVPPPENVVPLKLPRPLVNVQRFLPSLNCPLSPDDALSYPIVCHDFQDVNPNETRYFGFVADDPKLRIELELRAGHMWRLRDTPFPREQYKLWKWHVQRGDQERYLNTAILTSCMYLFNTLGGEDRTYHCFGTMATEYFLSSNHQTDGTHADIRPRLLAPKTRRQDSGGLMRLPRGTDFKDFHYLFFPFNPNHNHWHLVVADTRKRILLDFDSIPGRKRMGERPHVKALRHFLDKEWKASSKAEKWKSTRPPCMNQQDAHSCGVHTIVNTLLLLGGCDPAFASFNANEWRKRIFLWCRDGAVSLN